jgi:hypothetical protein
VQYWGADKWQWLFRKSDLSLSFGHKFLERSAEKNNSVSSYDHKGHGAWNLIPLNCGNQKHRCFWQGKFCTWQHFLTNWLWCRLWVPSASSWSWWCS